MKQVSALVLTAALLTAPAANAEKIDKKTADTLECSEFNDQIGEEPVNIAEISIKFDALDQVKEIKVQRNKTEAQEAFELFFNAKNSTLKHETIPGKIIDTDEETHKPIYDWNIEKIEMVEAESANGDKIRLHINDHTYSGVPGSTVYYTVKGKSFSSEEHGNQTGCEGKLRFRMWRQ